jgi:hypothetical protein
MLSIIINRMYKILCLIIIMIAINFAFVVNAQSTESILLPFSYDEVWNTDVINGRDDYGVHKDRLGVAMDFYTDNSALVLAPISGELEQGCTSQGVTLVAITNSAGLKIRLIHLLENTLKQTSGYIKQGSPIGMTAPKGDYNGPNCNVSSDGYHVHMSIVTSNPNNCAFNIDGYNIQCSGMRQCDNSEDGSYKLSFGVECNRKYLNKKFVSTNGFPLTNSQCDSLIKDANGPMSKDETNILNLQVCLTQANLYLGVYTRQFDDYTKSKVASYLNTTVQTDPTQVEIEAKAKAAKKAEVERLAEESRKSLEANKAEEEKLKLEAQNQRDEKKVTTQQISIDEKSGLERQVKEKEVSQNISRNINVLLSLALFIVATSIALLLTIRHKKRKVYS